MPIIIAALVAYGSFTGYVISDPEARTMVKEALVAPAFQTAFAQTWLKARQDSHVKGVNLQ